MAYKWDITTEEYIERAKSVHGDRYSYEQTEYIDRSTFITIICKKHGPIKVNPYTHIRLGTGCSKCALEKTKKTCTLTQEQFIERAKEYIGDHYDYSRVEYVNAHTPVIIGCPIHGWFKKYPMEVSQHKKGCPICANEKRRIKRCTGLESFIERSRAIYGDKFNYDKVVYVNQHVPVTITCPVHGDFQQLPQSHLRGNGCSKCTYPYVKGRPKENLVDDFRKIHGERYEYPKIPDEPRNTIKIPIRCKKHGIFHQRISNHLRGDGCPLCKNSKQENIIHQALNSNNIRFECQKTFSWLKHKRNMFLDFYLPDYGIAIECQGQQHFMETEWFDKKKEAALIYQYQRDRLKHSQCKEHGIKLLYFCYYEGWVPEDYIDKVYTTVNELVAAIKECMQERPL